MTATKKATPAAAVVVMPASRTVTFMDRRIEVKAPTPETLATWGRDIQRFMDNDKKAAHTDVEAYADLMDQLWDKLFSIVVHDEDVEWLRQGIRKNDVSILTAHQIMSDAMQAYENRAARRAK
jgi:hypothetical protein